MSLSRRGNGRPRPAMNVTPLVDVVLVLLIIFMVVLPAMGEGVSVALPTVDNADETQDGEMEPFLLTITQSGAFYFDTTAIRAGELETYLHEQHAVEPRRKIVIRADGAAPYVRIREMMHTCRQVGFPGVSLRVNARSEEAGETVASR